MRWIAAMFAVFVLSGTMAWAQSSPARLAWVGGGSAAGSEIFVAALRDGLRENGLSEGKDYVLDVQWADGNYARFPELAAEALKRKASIILINTIAAARAAQQATKTVPIVMMSLNDPVGAGLIDSYARPGGNTTGLASVADDIPSKMLEIARETFPRAARIVLIVNPRNPSNLKHRDRLRETAVQFGFAVDSVEVPTPDAIDPAFEQISKLKPDLLMMASDSALLDSRQRIAGLALRVRVPLLSTNPDTMEDGLLYSYGPSRLERYRRSAGYVSRILKGAKPADLPVELPSQILFAVNLRTARALGLTIPQTLLLRADRVVE